MRKIQEAIRVSKATGQYPATRAGQLVRKMDLAAEQMESLYTVVWPEDDETEEAAQEGTHSTT